MAPIKEALYKDRMRRTPEPPPGPSSSSVSGGGNSGSRGDGNSSGGGGDDEDGNAEEGVSEDGGLHGLPSPSLRLQGLASPKWTAATPAAGRLGGNSGNGGSGGVAAQARLRRNLRLTEEQQGTMFLYK